MSKKVEQLAYKVKTFARLTDLSERFVRQQIYDGKLEAIKVGSDWLISAEAARAFLSPRKERGRDQEESLATAA